MKSSVINLTRITVRNVNSVVVTDHRADITGVSIHGDADRGDNGDKQTEFSILLTEEQARKVRDNLNQLSLDEEV